MANDQVTGMNGRWYTVLDTDKGMSWQRDDLVFAVSRPLAEDGYKNKCILAGIEPGIVQVFETRSWIHCEPELADYSSFAQSWDFEAGEVIVKVFRAKDCIHEQSVTGRRGLNELHRSIVGYSPDGDAGTPLPMKELLQTVLGGLMFNIAQQPLN